MIEIKGISKSFDGRLVLNDISLDSEDGKCNMIIGASGSGKTVLMKSVMGLLKPDSGEILYDGVSLWELDYSQRKILSRNVGVLFQGSALFDFASVEQNVMFPMEFFTDFSRGEKLDRVNFLLEKVGLAGSNRKFPSELSGGMQKRVGIARALALNPKYLFCDEPNSGLDPVTSVRIDELIAEITREFGMTTIINTHDMNSILGIGDRISFLYQGNMIWSGDKTSILDSHCPELESFVSANALVRKFIRV